MQDALAVAFFFEVAHASAQQIFEREDADHLDGAIAIDHRKTCDAALRHAVHDRAHVGQ